ncbi:hypothetical protein ACQKEF_09885 [Pseudomonas oryzihabitans]|uniref:hypothetical protein n=1 Tax=Pseudomonas oryzihabitans TaxID=47885 RepID=UPI003D024C59
MTPIACLIGALLLAACGDSDSSKIELARKAVKEKLNDPDSAQFRNDRVTEAEPGVKAKGGFYVCGEVNAKNRMGGYTGFTQYVASIIKTDTAYVEIGPDAWKYGRCE